MKHAARRLITVELVAGLAKSALTAPVDISWRNRSLGLDADWRGQLH